MEQFKFDSEVKVKHERTHTVKGRVTTVEPYTANTSNGEVPGWAFQVEGVPYPLRLLKGSIKDAVTREEMIGAVMEFKGNTRVYNEKTYFNPLTASVVKENSALAYRYSLMAKAGLQISNS